MADSLFVKTGSFVIGNSVTNPICANGGVLAGITTGSGLTATALTFLASMDGTNYGSLYNSSNTEVSVTVTSASASYSLDFGTFLPWNYFIVREGTNASAINQTTSNVNILFDIMKW